MRVIVAGRLSRKVADRDQTGFDSQESESVRWAEQHGHQVVAVVADFKSGRSGLDARPKLRPWVTEPAKLAMFDGIVSLKMDRLTRGNREETADLEKWARDHGKALFITGMDAHFPSEGTEGIVWDLMLRQAHQEWLSISERYTRMQRTLRDAGSLVGRACYGYRIVKRDGVKTLEPIPAEASVIRHAAAQYLAGASLDTICYALNRDGKLPRKMKSTGKQPVWCAKTLSDALRNETIVGRRKSEAGVTILKCEPILDRDIWERVIRRMDARATRKGISQTNNPAMLTSVIRCGRCAKNMYKTGTGYYCRIKGCDTFVTLAVADMFVADLMIQDTHRDMIETLISGSNHDEEIAEVKRDMAEAVQAEDFARLASLKPELDRLRALPAEPTRVAQTLSDVTVAEMWAGMDDDAQRRQYLLARGATLTVSYRDDGKARRFEFRAPWHQVSEAA